jgi:hypothetical protein
VAIGDDERMLRSILLLVVLAVAVSLTGIAAARPAATKPPAPGVVLGGRTAQSWPIVIEVSHDGRQVVRADVALDVKCAVSGSTSAWSDRYQRVPISATGRFSSSFGPTPDITLASGQKGDVSGRLKGKLNARMTAGTGTWSFDVVVHDPTTGAVVDNCHSGNVTWRVKQ